VSAFAIRDARWPGDRAAAISFIHGLQVFEKQFEANRRVDDSVAGEYFDVMMARVAAHDGIVRIAEADGRAIGWAVAIVENNSIYVTDDERVVAFIIELYLVEEARGIGAGRALIASCEEWARIKGVKAIMIGVIPGNTRAAAVYQRAGYCGYSLQLRKYL
jgi:GNAT superfamily N-acetyltransferase